MRRYSFYCHHQKQLRPAGNTEIGQFVDAGAALRVSGPTAFLPCLIGDANPCLRRVGDYFEMTPVKLWILTHAQLRGSARVSAFIQWMRALVERDRDLLEGQRPAQAP